MSVSSLLQNTRCYICGLNILRSGRLLSFIRQHSYDSSVESEAIVIPKRIPRGPTDILKALATTVKRDPTAPHYKYHDDPYLIPVSSGNKRTYALSQESGRKAAIWIREKHANLFQHREAEPPIEAFLPKPRYDEFDDIDDTTLMKTIATASVNDAVEMYEFMLKNNFAVSDESKLALLELLCFFNENEDLAEELLEERWFAQSNNEKQVLKKTWKDKGYAERLFSELPPSPRSYSALIMGMVKYFQVDQAHMYYEEALKQGIPLSIGAYNAILKCTNFIKEGWEHRWKFIEEVLTSMNENGLKPNIQTLNGILDVLSRNPNAKDANQLALKMIAEVGQFGVEPSLGTYYFLLNIFCKQSRFGQNRCCILENILDYIHGKEFEIKDASDTLFFATAMENCRYHLHDMNLAFRLNELLWHGNNYNLIGNAFRESVYYRNFFLLMFESELMETIMEQYNYYVPNIYTPEIQVMEGLTKAVTMNGAAELYPRIWTDIVMFDMYDKNKVIAPLLQGMVLNRVPPADPPTEIAVKLADVAYSIFVKNQEVTHRQQIEWVGEMLGDIIVLCLCANDTEKAFAVAKQLFDNTQVLGIASTESLDMLLETCIRTKNLKFAMNIIRYCHDNSCADDRKLARKLIEQVDLSPMYETHLIALYGQDIFKEKSDKKAKKATG